MQEKVSGGGGGGQEGRRCEVKRIRGVEMISVMTAVWAATLVMSKIEKLFGGKEVIVMVVNIILCL